MGLDISQPGNVRTAIIAAALDCPVSSIDNIGQQAEHDARQVVQIWEVNNLSIAASIVLCALTETYGFRSATFAQIQDTISNAQRRLRIIRLGQIELFANILVSRLSPTTPQVGRLFRAAFQAPENKSMRTDIDSVLELFAETTGQVQSYASTTPISRTLVDGINELHRLSVLSVYTGAAEIEDSYTLVALPGDD